LPVIISYIFWDLREKVLYIFLTILNLQPSKKRNTKAEPNERKNALNNELAFDPFVL
jgi:hypothetical protein